MVYLVIPADSRYKEALKSQQIPFRLNWRKHNVCFFVLDLLPPKLNSPQRVDTVSANFYSGCRQPCVGADVSTGLYPLRPRP